MEVAQCIIQHLKKLKQEPVEQPVEQPVKQQVKLHIEQPVEQQVKLHIEQPVKQQVKLHIEQPVEQQVKLHIEQQIKQPVEQPTKYTSTVLNIEAPSNNIPGSNNKKNWYPYHGISLKNAFTN
jgi:hypothetical protein